MKKSQRIRSANIIDRVYPKLGITSANQLLHPGIDSKTFQRFKCKCNYRAIKYPKIKGACNASGPYGSEHA